MVDDGVACAICCTKCNPEKMSICDKCWLQYCTDCIDMHTCDSVKVFQFCNYVILCTEVAHFEIVLN